MICRKVILFEYIIVEILGVKVFGGIINRLRLKD